MCGTDKAVRSINSSSSSSPAAAAAAIPSDALINLDHGDPTIFEAYWRKLGDKCRMVVEGHESLSYFVDMKNMCWYMEPKLEDEIRRLHRTVGNAVVDDYQVVVGTGSSQLILSAFYALSSPDHPNPNSIICAVPYYSRLQSISGDKNEPSSLVEGLRRSKKEHYKYILVEMRKRKIALCRQMESSLIGLFWYSAEDSYPEMADFLKSGLYKWAGDAHKFDKDGPYIELITSPNNPDGNIRQPIVNRGDQGKLVYDLAYYWPQYTPITTPANSDIMLFTASKCTGHAGSRIGWALVKNKEVAKKMIKFIEVSTIGVSKESQLRTAKILKVISDSCQSVESPEIENFFKYGQRIMADRWQRLRNVVKEKDIFSLPKYPVVCCNFIGEHTETHPAFAWMKSKESVEDCEKLLREKNIATRSGRRFGSDPRYVRVSMVNRDEEFDVFLERLKDIKVD